MSWSHSLWHFSMYKWNAEDIETCPVYSLFDPTRKAIQLSQMNTTFSVHYSGQRILIENYNLGSPSLPFIGYQNRVKSTKPHERIRRYRLRSANINLAWDTPDTNIDGEGINKFFQKNGKLLWKSWICCCCRCWRDQY